MRLLRTGKLTVYLLALMLIQGLTMVLSSRFFDGFVSYTIPTPVMFGITILVGLALGWVAHEPRPLIPIYIGVFIGVFARERVDPG